MIIMINTFISFNSMLLILCLVLLLSFELVLLRDCAQLFCVANVTIFGRKVLLCYVHTDINEYYCKKDIMLHLILYYYHHFIDKLAIFRFTFP